MKVTILAVSIDKNKTTGELLSSMIVLGQFSDFGKIVPSTATVRISSEQVDVFSKLVGKETDLSLVFPKPQYPLQLS